MRVKPNMMHTWKEAVAAAYFLAFGVVRTDSLEPQTEQMMGTMA